MSRFSMGPKKDAPPFVIELSTLAWVGSSASPGPTRPHSPSHFSNFGTQPPAAHWSGRTHSSILLLELGNVAHTAVQNYMLRERSKRAKTWLPILGKLSS